MPNPIPPVYLVELTPLPARSPGIVRLRMALKAFLRSYGLKCLGVTERKPPAAPSEKEISS